MQQLMAFSLLSTRTVSMEQYKLPLICWVHTESRLKFYLISGVWEYLGVGVLEVERKSKTKRQKKPQMV
jgi:hypothetical protein